MIVEFIDSFYVLFLTHIMIFVVKFLMQKSHEKFYFAKDRDTLIEQSILQMKIF